jgi:hypothetical protein
MVLPASALRGCAHPVGTDGKTVYVNENKYAVAAFKKFPAVVRNIHRSITAGRVLV